MRRAAQAALSHDNYHCADYHDSDHDSDSDSDDDYDHHAPTPRAERASDSGHVDQLLR